VNRLATRIGQALWISVLGCLALSLFLIVVNAIATLLDTSLLVACLLAAVAFLAVYCMGAAIVADARSHLRDYPYE